MKVLQNTGAEQINRAIQQLDQVTQQNSATAEELSATAEELAGQAEQLQSTIAFFKGEVSTRKTKKNDMEPALEPSQIKPGSPRAHITHSKNLEIKKGNGNGKSSSYPIELDQDRTMGDDLDDEFERF